MGRGRRKRDVRHVVVQGSAEGCSCPAAVPDASGRHRSFEGQWREGERREGEGGREGGREGGGGREGKREGEREREEGGEGERWKNYVRRLSSSAHTKQSGS